MFRTSTMGREEERFISFAIDCHPYFVSIIHCRVRGLCHYMNCTMISGENKRFARILMPNLFEKTQGESGFFTEN